MSPPQSLTDGSDAADGGRGVALLLALVVTLSAVLHAILIAHAPPLQSANDRSRWCTIRALLEEGTYRIDNVRRIPGWDTIDLVRHEGHFYSSKPPFMSTWVMGVVWGVTRTTGWSFDRDMPAIQTATLWLVNLLPFTLTLIAFAIWLRRSTNGTTAIVILIVAGFATLLSPFLTTLNNHTPAALAVWWALLCALSPPTTGWSRSLRFGVWGLSAGLAACHDLPAAAFTVAMAAWAFRTDAFRTLWVFLPAALLTGGGFFAANLAALGTPFPAYSGYGGDTYRFQHEGIPSYWLQPQGVDRNLDGPAMYFIHCTIGHHGWWLLTPVWLVVLLPGSGSGRPWTRDERLTRWLTYGLTAIVLGFCLTRTKNYNYGGVSCALRWALFLTPLWLASLAAVVDRLRWSRGTVAVGTLLLAGSVYSAWSPLGRPWQQPWAYRLCEAWGWLPPPAPSPPLLTRELVTWFDRLPPSDAAAPRWIEYRRDGIPHGTETLRLTWTGEETINKRRCAVLTMERRREGVITATRTYRIERAKFDAGRPPAEFLVWTERGVTPEQQQADMAFVRGLPRLKSYVASGERYVKTALRTDALACVRCAAMVDVVEPAGAPWRRFRSEVWLAPELPFGPAKVEWTITDPTSQETLSREVWQVTACEPPIAPTTPVQVEMFDRPEPITRQLETSRPAASRD